MIDSTKNTTTHSETLLEFPCEYPLKIMGNNHENFQAMMCELLSTHIKHDLDSKQIQQRPSANGKYIALTITITAESKQQLDDIYQALYEHADVKMTL